MLTRVDAEPDNGFLAKRLGSLQPVQTLDQYKARPIGPHQDRGLMAAIKHARCNVIYTLLLDRGAPFDRHVDVGDQKVSRFIMLETDDSIGEVVRVS